MDTATLDLYANTSNRRAIGVARRAGATAWRFRHTLARLDERMEAQSFRTGSDAPVAVALMDRFHTWAGMQETKRSNLFSTELAGVALRSLHKLQARHRTIVEAFTPGAP